MSGSNKMHPISDEFGRIKNFDFCSEMEPTQTWAYMTWINPLTQEIQVRNKTNTAWISVGGGGGGSHHETHEDGGDDEISVAGLSGVLADRQDADHLQGRDIADAEPADGDVLTWDDGESAWEPAAAAKGWPYEHVITVDPADPDADYTNLDDALAAASGGDVIELGPSTSTYQVHNDIDVGVTIRGYTQPGHQGSTVNPCHLEFHGPAGTTDLNGPCRFQDLELDGRLQLQVGFVTVDSCVINIYSFITSITYAPGNGRIIFRNCEFIGHGGLANLPNSFGTLEFYDCWFRTNGATTINHGTNGLVVANFNWDGNVTISGAGTRTNVGKPIAHAGTDAAKGTPFFDGELYYATDIDTLYIGDGGSWVGGGGGAHHTTHENGGADEISVAGLSGELADAQPPKAHKTNHQDGGTDEISVAGLTGVFNPNLLVNAGHEIWQRGAGAFTATNAYTADRWQIILAGTDTLSVSRDGVNKKTDSLYASACTFVLGSGAGATQYRQALVISDQYHGLLGQTISLRIPIKLAAGADGAVRAFITTDGTGGTTTYSGYHGNNTNWENLDSTVTVPSDATYIRIGVAFAASCTAYVDNCSLVLGSVAVDYQGEHPAELWERCQRYYEAHGGSAVVILQGYGLAANNESLFVGFSTRKAVSPTMTKSGTWTVSNCAQPITSGGNNTTYRLYTTVTATGGYYTYCDSADDLVTAEANP